MRCCRKKATALVKELSHGQQVSLSDRMRTSAFTISTDGSNDDKSKQFALVIRSVNINTGLVSSELLSIPICKGSATGENIFKLLESELTRRNVPWTNCLAVGCDNGCARKQERCDRLCSQRAPRRVYGWVLPALGASRCTQGCGLSASCRRCAGRHLLLLQEVRSGNASLQIFNNSSTLTKKRMLKHVCTRWLSIGRCLGRLLHNWKALKAFFKAEKDAHAKHVPAAKKDDGVEKPYAERKVDSVFTFLKSPTNKLYVLFLDYTVKVYDDVLVTLQSDEPKIHALRQALLKVLCDLLTRFVKPAALIGRSPEAVDLKNNSLRDKKLKHFYSDVKKYFAAVCTYMVEKTPFREPMLRHTEIADVRGQLTAKLSDLSFFVTKCPALLVGASVDTVTEQFSLYQCTDICTCLKSRMDETWFAIRNITDEDGGKPPKHLASVMLGVLAIPQSHPTQQLSL